MVPACRSSTALGTTFFRPRVKVPSSSLRAAGRTTTLTGRSCAGSLARSDSCRSWLRIRSATSGWLRIDSSSPETPSILPASSRSTVARTTGWLRV